MTDPPTEAVPPADAATTRGDGRHTSFDPAIRARDIKVLVVAAVGLILAGAVGFFAIRAAGGGGGETSECGKQRLGVESELLKNPDYQLIPQYRYLGSCAVIITVRDDVLYAVKPDQEALGCSVTVDGQTKDWLCDDDVVDFELLETYPTEVRDVGDDQDVLFVDFEDQDADAGVTTTS